MMQDEFDPRGCRAVFAMLVAFWIIVGAIVAEVMDFSIWEVFA